MIKSFGNKETERIFQGQVSVKYPKDIQQRAYDKLKLLHAAESLNDLRLPPSNRLEKLSRDRAGQHSIRINQQWRICFKWVQGHAASVEIVDYH